MDGGKGVKGGGVWWVEQVQQGDYTPPSIAPPHKDGSRVDRPLSGIIFLLRGVVVHQGWYS